MTESVQNALAWIRREPAVLLAGVLNWIPGLFFSAAALSVAPQIRGLFSPNSPNPIADLMAHSQELLQWIFPFLLFLLVLFVVAMMTRSIASLALVYAAEQFQNQKPLSLNDAFAAAWKRWKKLVASEIMLFIAVFAVVLAVALVCILLIISIVGIILLVILAIPGFIALVVGAMAMYAMLLFLPAIIAFQEFGIMESLKASFRFVWQNKMASAGLVLLSIGSISVLNLITNAIGGMVGSILGMLCQLFIGSLAALAATSYWLDVQKMQSETPANQPENKGIGLSEQKQADPTAKPLEPTLKTTNEKPVQKKMKAKSAGKNK